MSDDPPDTGTVQSVDEIPLCHGCGFMSHYIHDETPLCPDCWNKRNFWQAGGPLRVVTRGMNTYHETPLCPAVKNANRWFYWRDEECMYADLADQMDKCSRCHSFRTFGFDHYEADSVVVGHA